MPKGPRGAIEVFHKTHYNDTNDHYNDTNGWTSEFAEALYVCVYLLFVLDF